MLFGCLLRLYKAGIPVVLVIGNHDNPLSFGKAHTLELFDQLPLDGFHVINKPRIIQLATAHGPVNIVGIPWPTRTTLALNNLNYAQTPARFAANMSDAVSAIIKELAQRLDPTIPAVLAAHMTVSTGILSGSERRAIYGEDPMFLTSQLALPPFDYVALGHLHRHQNLNKNGIPVVYSGSIERIDFGERNEEKGFCLVSIEKKGTTSYDFITVPTRPFIQINVELEKDRSQTEMLVQAIKKHTITHAIVKITYQLAEDMNDTVDLKVIHNVLKDAHFVVGVIPLRHAKKREQRALLSVDMDLEQLLNTYFDTKPEYALRKQKLIQEALQLSQEINDQEQT
jgi:exonuclease SbcD